MSTPGCNGESNGWPAEHGVACRQVYISYGQKTSGQLLLSYGFVPEAGSNTHDACMLELKLSADDPSFHSKVACLRQYGIEATSDFPLRLNALPQALLLFAAFRQAQTIDAAEVTSLGRQLFERVCILASCNSWSLAMDFMSSCKHKLRKYLSKEIQAVTVRFCHAVHLSSDA